MPKRTLAMRKSGLIPMMQITSICQKRVGYIVTSRILTELFGGMSGRLSGGSVSGTDVVFHGHHHRLPNAIDPGVEHVAKGVKRRRFRIRRRKA